MRQVTLVAFLQGAEPHELRELLAPSAITAVGMTVTDGGAYDNTGTAWFNERRRRSVLLAVLGTEVLSPGRLTAAPSQMPRDNVRQLVPDCSSWRIRGSSLCILNASRRIPDGVLRSPVIIRSSGPTIPRSTSRSGKIM
jgi:hypothetical protein